MPPRTGRLLERDTDLAALLNAIRTIAVLGIRSEAAADRPAHYVPAAAQGAGYRIVPVPVYEPEVTRILGQKVFRSLADVDITIDLVDVFRKPSDLPQHLTDVLASKPRAVWLQSGIRSDSFADAVTQAGIDVVMDRCLMVEMRRLGTHPPKP